MAKRQARKAGADQGEKKTYLVAPGHTLTTRVPDDDGNMGDVLLEAGDEIELTEAQALSAGAAVETPEKRERNDGQTRRLKRKLAELEAENERLRAAAKPPTKEDRKNLDAAAESLRARGDNFIGRGEPEIGKVPKDVEESFDNQRAPVDMEELSGGMKGLGNERGSGREERGATNKPGESQRPGATEPTSKPEETK